MEIDENEIYKSFLCPISYQLMENPVIASDGHCYERSSIENWFDQGKDTSPITGLKLPNKALISNYNLKCMISFYKQNPHLLTSDKIKKQVSPNDFETSVFFNSKSTEINKKLTSINSNDNCNSDSSLGEFYYLKSKKYRIVGKIMLAIEALELAFLERNIFSYFIYYFYLTGKIGNNEIIRKNLNWEKTLHNLMCDKILYIETEAKEKKNLDAIAILGEMYFEGIIYEKNINKSKEILLSASYLNCPFCINLLAKIFYQEKNSVCVNLYLKAADLNYFYAKNNFAFLNKNGIYIKKDVDKYKDILENLANVENNFYLAQYDLGLFYYNENKNFSKAYYYFKKSAENLHIPSMEVLSEFYENGIHVKKDLNQALYWKSKAIGSNYGSEILTADYKINKEKNSEKIICEMKENIEKLNSEIQQMKINQGLRKKNSCSCSIF